MGAAAESDAVTDRVSVLSTNEVIERVVLASVTAEVAEPADGALSARSANAPLIPTSEISVAVNVVESVAVFAAVAMPVKPERVTIDNSTTERENTL